MTGPTTTPCRALVAGFGRPGMRDLDFGRQIIDYLKQLEWPDGVVVEDLSLAAPLVLHRLQELQPAKLVLVGPSPGTSTRLRPCGAGILISSPRAPTKCSAGSRTR